MRSPSAGRRRALSLALLAGSLSTGAVQAQTHTVPSTASVDIPVSYTHLTLPTILLV